MTAEAEARRALHADPQCAHRWTALMACDFCDAHDPAGLDAPDAARLDVERLARAIHASNEHPNRPGCLDMDRDTATYLAREYTALDILDRAPEETR